MLSKAFSNSPYLMYNCLCHSVHCSKTCLLLSKSLVHCFRDNELGWDLAGDRRKDDYSPFVTVAQGSFLWNLHDDTLRPVNRQVVLNNLCCKIWLCLEEFCIEAVLSRGFPYLRDAMDAMISFYSGGTVLTPRSVSGSCTSASIIAGVLVRASLKYSAHFASSLPCLFKFGSESVALTAHRSLVILYTCPCSPLFAGSSA